MELDGDLTVSADASFYDVTCAALMADSLETIGHVSSNGNVSGNYITGTGFYLVHAGTPNRLFWSPVAG